MPHLTRNVAGPSAVEGGRAHLWPVRLSKPDSPRRAPFPGWQPRPAKAARCDVPVVPAHIRAAEHDLGADDRAYIRRKLGRALGKFAPDIVRVSVRTEDLNGPRGGIDRVCRIKVVLYGLPSVVFEKRDAALNAAVDAAVAGAEQAVRRALLRRRMALRRRSPPQQAEQ